MNKSVTDHKPLFAITGQKSPPEFEVILRTFGRITPSNAPYHLADSGEAERSVQTCKNNMKCRGSSKSSFNICIDRFLQSYRTTHATICSPSFLLMGWRDVG